VTSRSTATAVQYSEGHERQDISAQYWRSGGAADQGRYTEKHSWGKGRHSFGQPPEEISFVSRVIEVLEAVAQ